MRIVYDHQIVGSQKFGGVSRYIYELAQAMATTHGQDVKILSPLFANRYLKAAPEAVRIVGVPIPHVQGTGRIVLAINSLLVRPMMRHLSPDLVHETYYSRRRVAPRSAKVVLTVYDMIHERFKKDYPSDTTSRDKALAVERADHVICISEQTRQDLVDLLHVDPAKTSVVHLGFAWTNRGAQSESARLADRPFLLYVGHRGSYKNFDGLLRVYAVSSTLRDSLDIVCFGGGAFRRDEIAAIRRLGLSVARIRQVSGDDARLETYYRAAAALVYPSLYEGFGIPLLEAMSFDCPVVCSRVGAIPEIVGDAGELFNPYDVDSMQTAIERVVSGDRVRQNLVSRGRERIKSFSWARCAQETFEVYQRLFGNQ
jgi:glycosyltransferase involved in cell wall biosynthesis